MPVSTSTSSSQQPHPGILSLTKGQRQPTHQRFRLRIDDLLQRWSQKFGISERLQTRNVPQFEYKALPKSQIIRVIKLEPGVWDSPIRCSLKSYNLDNDKLSYEAISYVWGTSPDRKEIICDGKPFDVTTGLFDALQIFRQIDQPRALWADAICINQKDTEERNHQVQLMRIIYSKAAKVLIWLGHEHPDIVRSGLDAVCRFVNEACSAAQRDDSLAEYIWGGQDSRALNRNILPESTEVEDMKSIGQLFACTWFTRLWVVQEVVLSSVAAIHWGNAVIDFRWLGLLTKHFYYSAMYRVFRLHNGYDSILGYQNCYFIHNLQQSSQAQNFYSILTSTLQFDVSDPRDRVFGLLGMRSSDSDPDQGNLFLEPNYNVSLSEVMENVTTKFLLDQKIVNVLSRVQNRHSILDDRTSWMPQWNNLNDWILGGALRKTTGDVLPSIFRPICDFVNCLAINGITVEPILDIMSSELDQSRQIYQREMTFAISLKTLIERLQGEYDSETVAYTLTAGFASDFGVVEDHGAHIAEFKAFLAWDLEQIELTNENTIPPPLSLESPEARAAASYLELFADVTDHRRLFKTETGALGLGPEAMREGDIVTVLFGGNVPYVLRPVGDGHYRLVGECYFHSVMGGQAVEEWKKSGEPAKEFHIY
jgi:hypothetical protein